MNDSNPQPINYSRKGSTLSISSKYRVRLMTQEDRDIKLTQRENYEAI